MNKMEQSKVEIKFVRSEPAEQISEEYDLGEMPELRDQNILEWQEMIDFYFSENNPEQIKKDFDCLPTIVRKRIKKLILNGISEGLDKLLETTTLNDSNKSESYRLSGEVKCFFSEDKIRTRLAKTVYNKLKGGDILTYFIDEEIQKISKDIAEMYLVALCA